VIVKESHGGFEVLEAKGVNLSDLFIGDLAPHNQFVELFSSGSFRNPQQGTYIQHKLIREHFR
jgi:hypothetical protein